jgi:hypothetical protein
VGLHDLDLSERLLIARRGTAYFAQRLAELADADLDADGWTRQHLIAHVGYTVAARCRLLPSEPAADLQGTNPPLRGCGADQIAAASIWRCDIVRYHKGGRKVLS